MWYGFDSHACYSLLRRRTSSVIKNDWMSLSHTLFCSWIEAFQATFAENQRDSFYCFVWRAASGGHWLCQSTSILKARVYILYTLWRNSILCSKIQIFSFYTEFLHRFRGFFAPSEKKSPKMCWMIKLNFEQKWAFCRSVLLLLKDKAKCRPPFYRNFSRRFCMNIIHAQLVSEISRKKRLTNLNMLEKKAEQSSKAAATTWIWKEILLHRILGHIWTIISI